MPLIPEHLIDEVQTRTDIAELIGRYVPLKRAGRHFKALCPFHKEKTPSFMVNTDKQIFHCFGCGAGGNIFSFLMQHDRLSFREAVQQLADHVGVRIPNGEADTSDGLHERLRALMEKACQYFERQLLDPQAGRAARAYLQQRGVSERTRQAFRLGLAPAGWDRLLKAARATGVSVDLLESAGLLVRSTSKAYDRFRSRLMFPITDARGRIIGFGGRSLDGQEPKYLNSPETALYRKGHHLFGLAQAKDAILKAKSVIVVEGYFDCVVLADAGIAHVVSPLGTALTVEQARLLRRYAEDAILAFDADAAGEAATLRGIDLLIETGLRVRIARLPSGIDPDECLRTYGRERFEQLLADSIGLFEFLVEVALRRFSTADAEGKVLAARFVLPTIAKVPDAMLRSEYVRKLSQRLNLDEHAVAEELAKVQPRGYATAPRAAEADAGRAKASVRSVTQGPEQLLTALVLDDPARWARVREQVSLDDITDGALRKILAVSCELHAAGEQAAPAQVVSRLSEPAHGGLVTELVELAQSIEAKDAALEDCLRRLRVEARKRRQAHLREQIRVAQDAGQEEAVSRFMAEYQQSLSGALGG